MKRLIAAVVAAFLGATPAAAQEKLTVLLDWFVNPDHGPLIVAQEMGYFKELGLEVELIAPADPNDPPKLVAAGKGDIAVGYQKQLPLQAEQGLPLVRIGTLIDTPLSTMVVLRDGPVKTLADLKGRKIGFAVAGFQDAVVGAMLETAGLTVKDVTMVSVNFALTTALLSGQVDAVIGAFRNFELNALDLKGKPGRAFYQEEYGVPPYDELVFVANKNRLNDPRLPKFIAAVERATLYLINHPDESWKLFIKGRRELDDELNKRAWRDTLPRFAHAPAALDIGRYERFAKFLKDRGLLKTVPPVESYAVQLR